MAPERPTLPTVLRTVAGLTVASGAAQLVAPGVVLRQISPAGDRHRDALSRHLFGTVGMFMVASGGVLYRAATEETVDPRLLTWCAVQKLGASGAVALGVARSLFARRALLVATFDLASGIACLVAARQALQPREGT